MTTPMTPPDLERIVNLHAFEPLARERMDSVAFDYYASGAWDEVTLAENLAAWRRRRLRPRVLVDVSAVSTATTILGVDVEAPFGIAPMAAHGLADPEGEVATARAAAAAGTLFCLSTVSSRSIEEVAAAPAGPRWFQLYVRRAHRRSRELVERAEAAGYRAIVLTVDLPVLGYRDRDRRHGYELDIPLANLPDLDDDAGLADIEDAMAAALTWADVPTIRGWSSLPLVLKGILTPEDARRAVDAGAAAVWVSNHGGRQLDRVPAAVDVLADVAAAVGDAAEVYADGGVRRGVDVVTGLALGARAVFVGRPVLYGLAVAGVAGVGRVLDILREETAVAMALVGARSPGELGPTFLMPR